MTGLSLPVLNPIPNEPHHDKTCLWGFRPGGVQEYGLTKFYYFKTYTLEN